MLAPFMICFREGIEIFLVIIPLFIYFSVQKEKSLNKYVLSGCVTGFFVALAVATLIYSEVSIFNGMAEEYFDGGLGIILAVLILISIVLIRKNQYFNIQLNKSFTSLSKKGLFIISSVTFFRELLEAILFTLRNYNSNLLLLIAFSAFGFIVAFIVVLFAAKGIFVLNFNIVFYILNLYLIGLGAFYFGDGLGTLTESFIPNAKTLGILLFAIPSYLVVLKSDLKRLISSARKK